VRKVDLIKLRCGDKLSLMAAKKKGKKTRANKVRTTNSIPRRSAKKKASQRKMTPKKNVAARSRQVSNSRAKTKRRRRPASLGSPEAQTLSGDPGSQGLSTVERADSESVGELLEEGNTFEAGVVKGVEQAEDADEREVRTRQVPEDDVPEEYLDKD
jgi:hypothetical protein